MKRKTYTFSKVASAGLNILFDIQDASKSVPKFVITIADILATVTTLLTIDIYKIFFDTHKHGKCSHKLLHGQCSCSDYIKKVVIKYGAVKASSLIKQRSVECKEAYYILNAGGSLINKHNSNFTPLICFDNHNHFH
ncbi:MAG: membrane protein insertion efficiency factor YidD [Okeania sp. SIO2F4]|uniref:membrane protein insertion efficiency factor YidD n=1 Tax=Okeania sp. SIO2F4 TaxID=2607790 RepID=UPI00142C0C55|nr:membrane protein insertion efficiency factor YidD [Okeania sp. SIO2F4]NES03488.1 membrane protein insertion efficiency factor YidD [Okeania sp. SIO2F4]